MRSGMSLAQAILSLSATVLLWGLALLSLILSLYLKSEGGLAGAESGVMFASAVNLGLLGLLLLPGAWYGFRNQTEKTDAAQAKEETLLQRSLPSLLLFGLLPLVLAAGIWLSQNTGLSTFALPFLNILAVCIPVYWLTNLALNGLPERSAQRTWGLLGSGLTLGPGASLVVEISLLLAGIVTLALAAGANPALAQEIQTLTLRLQFGVTSPSALERMLQSYLSQPWVILVILGAAAVIVPLIEETFKPLGLWLLANRQLSPAEGFAGGVLSGAGFVIFESLFMNVNIGIEQWAGIALMRIGTAAIHIAACGLTGWGLAAAWSEKNYGKLAAGFGGAVLLHGLWNGLAIGVSLVGLQNAGESPALVTGGIGVAMGLLVAGSIAGLAWANRRLRSEPLTVLAAPELPPAEETAGES